MKTLSELEKFYQSDLLGDLRILERKRKAVLQKVLYAGVLVAALVAVAVAVCLYVVHAKVIFAVMFPVVLGFGIMGIIIKSLTRGYRSEFKGDIIRKIVKFIDDNLDYSPGEGIAQSTFVGSQIFKHSIDRYRCEDLVSGKVGATEIAFSEVHAEYKTETTDSKGRRQTHWHTIFKGLFFVGDFNKDFSGCTVVLPDTAERLLGRIGQKLQSLNFTRGKLIKLEDPEFEKEFVVYGDDQVEARYVLSTSLMKRIVEFKRKSGRKIHLSFVGARVFVAISYNRGLFEPRLFRTLLDFGPIKEYYSDMQVATGVVDDLNLNTRIWGKN